MVDNNQFINKFNKIFLEFERKNKKVLVFMIFKTDEIGDKWSVLTSGSWGKDKLEKEKRFIFLLKLMKKSLDSEELKRIARIGVFDSSHDTIKAITDAINMKKGLIRLQKTTLNNLLINDGYLFKSLKDSKEIQD